MPERLPLRRRTWFYGLLGGPLALFWIRPDTTDPNETRIRLSNGKEGWVAAESVEPILRVR